MNYFTHTLYQKVSQRFKIMTTNKKERMAKLSRTKVEKDAFIYLLEQSLAILNNKSKSLLRI